VFFCFIVKDCPELESRFEERIWVAVRYASTIDDFDELVDPQNLARHSLGPEPSHYILRAILWKKKVSHLRTKVNRLFFLFFSPFPFFSFSFLTFLLFLFFFCRNDD